MAQQVVEKTTEETLVEQNKTLLESVEAQKETISELKGKVDGITQMAPAAAPPVTPAKPPMTKQEFNAKMVEDPSAALEHFAATKLAPLVHENLNSSVSTQRTFAEQKHTETFAKWGDEITALENQVDKTVLASPGAYDYIIKQVRANHIDEIVEEKIAAKVAGADKPKIVTQDLSISEGSPSSREANELPQGTELSDDQKEVCKGLGVSEEDYIEHSNPRMVILQDEENI
jgi:hypothetical protein